TGPVQGLTSGTMLRVVYRNPGWSYLIPSYPSQLHAMTLYEISAGSCQIHERLGSWIQLRRGWRCQSSNNQHVPVLQQGCRMSRTIKFCETRKDEGTCGRVVDLGNYASTTDEERWAGWQHRRRVVELRGGIAGVLGRAPTSCDQHVAIGQQGCGLSHPRCDHISGGCK